MFSSVFFKLILASLLSRNKFIGCNFVTIGEYFVPGVNLILCGLKYEPSYHRVEYNQKCFKNYYPTTVYVNAQGFFYGKEVDLEKRIIGGAIAQFGEAPWAVQVSFRENDRPDVEVNDCSGSLITPQWVLTAAHCLRKNRTIYVYAGQVEKGMGIAMRGIATFIHYNWDHNDDNRFKYDIGLIKLESHYPLHLYSFKSHQRLWSINPICLPKWSPKKNRDIEIADFFGFGRYIVNRTNNFLRKMIVTINPAHYSCYDEEVLCANITLQRTFRGDSGGGLVYYNLKRNPRRAGKALLLGVSSGGNTGKGLLFFTPIVPHVSWIVRTIKKNC